MKNPTENAFIAQDGIGAYDWSYQAKEKHPTNYALMALTSSGISSSSDSAVDSCSRTCLQSVEERLAHYKKNEVVFEEKINILNLEVKLRDNALVENTKKLEKAEKERHALKLTLEKFQHSSKSSNNLLENQKNIKSRSNKGYHAVPPPYTGNYIPAKPDLMFIDEQVESEPISNAFKRGHSQVRRPYNKYSAYKKTIFNKMVNTVRVKDTTAREREVKEYKEKEVIDGGCSRNMIGNKCYLTDYEDYDGGFVSFGDDKGRIYGKGKIKTKTLDFGDVYFCKELKYNLFSVSQMCDKKNTVLFTDTKSLVLSSNFKLLNESQVLLRVPRKDNIYSVDLQSVVPTRERKATQSLL
nr:ribonuclease H-like domain-containing protein [Tanacetum cinerariifolium]